MSSATYINLALGSSQIGLTLNALLTDKTGLAVFWADGTAAQTTTFVEIGMGNYLFWSDQFPTEFTGGVIFIDVNTAVIKAFVAINETDWLTAPIVWAYSSRTLTTYPGGPVIVAGPFDEFATPEIVAGDDYAAADGRALEWVKTDGTWPNLTGATVTLLAHQQRGSASFSATGSIVVPTGAGQKVRVPILAASTAQKDGLYNYQLLATLAGSGRKVTLALGDLIVLAEVTVP